MPATDLFIFFVLFIYLRIPNKEEPWILQEGLKFKVEWQAVAVVVNSDWQCPIPITTKIVNIGAGYLGWSVKNKFVQISTNIS